VNSSWIPDQPPFRITQHLGNFEIAIVKNFRPVRGRSNLTKFQAKILQDIRSNENIIIAHADKNLGPVGVNTEQYIHWALKHLLDANTYVKENEEEAQKAASDLFLEIYLWTQRNQMCSSLTQNATAYIRHWIQKIASIRSDTSISR
jgi:hypothetical protein